MIRNKGEGELFYWIIINNCRVIPFLYSLRAGDNGCEVRDSGQQGTSQVRRTSVLVPEDPLMSAALIVNQQWREDVELANILWKFNSFETLD